MKRKVAAKRRIFPFSTNLFLGACFFLNARYFYRTMRNKNSEFDTVPAVVSLFRVINGLLFLHAAAIIGITFFLNTADRSGITPERAFSLAVASPMLLGSFFFWLATTARTLFATGVFFCFFVALTLAALPFMMHMFFPTHLAVFGLAALYAFSGIILMRYFFAQPAPKKK